MDNQVINFANSLRLAAAFATIALGLFFLYTISDILLIFLAAFIFAIALDKPLDTLVRRGVHRGIATIFIYSLFLIFTLTVVVLAVPPLVQEVKNFTLDISGRVQTVELEIDMYNSLSQGAAGVDTNDYIRTISDFFQSSSQIVIDTAMKIYSGLITFLIIFFLALFLNIQRDGVKQFIGILVPFQYQQYATKLFEKVQRQVSNWLWGKTVSSFFVAIIIFPGLIIFDIPYAVTFTVLAFFLNYIPFAGPFLASLLPIFLGLLISPLHAIAVAFLYFFANTVEGFIIIPLLLKQSIQLNPLLLIFAVLVGGRLGGVLGIMIAIPVVAVMTLLFEEYQIMLKKSKSQVNN
jgi:predicted PurR-regulated permease PerM